MSALAHNNMMASNHALSFRVRVHFSNTVSFELRFAASFSSVTAAVQISAFDDACGD